MRKISLAHQVLIAVVFGVFVGLFFGPLTIALKPIGDIYTMLLQMAVLPYIIISLVHGLGSMMPEMGVKIFKSSWIFFLTLWVLIFLLIFLLSSLIPETFSPIIQSDGRKQIESAFIQNYLSYLVPQNPIYDIAHNIVPAISIFGLIGGIALMHVQKKEPLISSLERINQVIEKVLHWLGILSPVGAFVYIALAAGTIHFEDLEKIGLYVFTVIATTLFFTFWFLPILITSLTPITYKEVVKTFQKVCLLPFVTGLTSVALPFINDFLKKFAQKHETHEKFRETSQTILPIAYSFGNIGNALILFFIFFLAYYYRHPLNDAEKLLLSFLSLPLSVGTSTGNIPSVLFLIDQLGFPEGASQFFLEIKAFSQNFQVMMSIASVLTLIILSIYSYYGLLQVKWKHLIIRIVSPIVVFSLGISLIHLFTSPPKDVYQNLYMDLSLSNLVTNPPKVQILKEGEAGAPRSFPDPIIPSALKQIVSTDTLKVGFNSYSIPFCYYNHKNELVGFDMAYAYALARDLDCKLQLIPFDFDNLVKDLSNGTFDIAMSSVIMSEDRLLQMEFAKPYLEDNNVLIVPSNKSKEFLHLDEVKQKRGLKIGAVGVYNEIAKKYFPLADVIDIINMDRFLNSGLDAMIWSKTTAIIWCTLHPQFVTIDYGSIIGRCFFSYPMHQHATDFAFFLNNWLILKEQSGFYERMKRYWLDGIELKKRAPRWSIWHNVLHFKNLSAN